MPAQPPRGHSQETSDAMRACASLLLAAAFAPGCAAFSPFPVPTAGDPSPECGSETRPMEIKSDRFRAATPAPPHILKAGITSPVYPRSWRTRSHKSPQVGRRMRGRLPGRSSQPSPSSRRSYRLPRPAHPRPLYLPKSASRNLRRIPPRRSPLRSSSRIAGSVGAWLGSILTWPTLGARLDDVGQGRLLEIGGAGNGLDQVGDQVGAALVLVLDLGPLGVDPLFQTDELIVVIDPEGADNYGEKNDAEDGEAGTTKKIFTHKAFSFCLRVRLCRNLDRMNVRP